MFWQVSPDFGQIPVPDLEFAGLQKIDPGSNGSSWWRDRIGGKGGKGGGELIVVLLHG